MSRVAASIFIPAPPSEVWDLVMNADRLGDWVTIQRRLEHADDGTPRPGYEMEQRLHLRGVDLKVHWTLVECQADRKAVWEGRGPARSHAHTEYTLTAEGDGTRFDYVNEFIAPLGPIGAVASRALVGGMPAREANRSLERLRGLFDGAGDG